MSVSSRPTRNCKPRDLALVTCGPNAGKVVTCLEALPAGFKRDDLPLDVHQEIDAAEGPLWRTDRALDWGDLVFIHLAPDAVLMPIRPNADQRRKAVASST